MIVTMIEKYFMFLCAGMLCFSGYFIGSLLDETYSDYHYYLENCAKEIKDAWCYQYELDLRKT
jgi:hypothetical protein